MREADVVKVVGIRRSELRRWVEAGLVVPARDEGEFRYREIDVARVRLIRQVRRDLAVPEDLLPTVLSLVDQVYGLRNELRRVGEAIEAQPEKTRQAIVGHLTSRR